MTDVWIKNGTQLGLLIEHNLEEFHVYRMEGAPEFISGFEKPIPCDPVLKGFELNLTRLKNL